MTYSVTHQENNHPQPAPICCHCGEKVASRPRGLCRRCWTDPDIRSAYGRIDGRAIPKPSEASKVRRFKKPKHPTNALPGSAEKIRIMAERVANGELANHPDDRKLGPG